ncbi:hypothetical protein AVEN_12743-1 [Araneus ventricosus]|uniref:Uncharacterized protein n=1 Tax=Araneus ventricosus TaxID=182803 RepID=A0A4Y2AB30_ARAVE|nr:hypothetical protein AVEN_12743-1 [Araneus ventricosus]
MWGTAGGGGWWCGGGLGEGWCVGFHPASSRAEEPPCSHAREPRPLMAQVDLARPRGLREYILPGRNHSTTQSSGTRRCPPNSTTDYSCRQPSQYPSAANPKSHDTIAHKIFKLLHSHPHIRVSWIKVHVGYIGNEKADRLAKEAAETENFPETPLELPESFIKTFRRQKMMSTWKMTWDDEDTGRLTS